MPSSSRTVLAAAGAALILVASGCGGDSSSTAGGVNPNGPEVSPPGDIPDNQAFVAYAPPGGGYSVKVPEGWSRASAGGVVSFTDKLNTIEMQSRAARAALSAGRARSSDVPRLARTVKGFKLRSVSTVRRRGGTAVRVSYLATGRPDAVTGKVRTDAVERYVFFHRGRDVVLTLSGPKGADNVDPWRIVTDSLRWSR
jgi:hypothetical protein